MKHYSIGEVCLAVRDHNEDCRTTILFVHGFPFDGAMWGHLIASPPFSTSEIDPIRDHPRFRFIIPDLRGFGESTLPSQPGTTVTMERFADDLALLVSTMQIRERFFLCGLSMGGYVALEFARKHSALLAGLVLCNTRATPDMPEIVANRLRLADGLDNGRDTVAGVAEGMWPKLLAPQTLHERTPILEEVRQLMHRQSPLGLAAASRGMAERRDSTQLVQEIDIPILVIAGADDVLTPSEGMQRLAALGKHAQFCEVPSAGHLGPMENPAAYAGAIDAFATRLT